MSATLDDLLDAVRMDRGLDLRGYRRDALARRVAVRMRVLGAAGVAEYHARLRVDDAELDALLDAALAPTTGLFRDDRLVDELARDVLPALCARHDGPIVVWCARCGAGQEAYALAMLLAEELGPQAFARRVEILAGDPDAAALETARGAVYAADELAAVPAGLQERYFTSAPGGLLRVRADLCRRVRFLWADPTDGPPVAPVDLVSCRDVLARLAPEERDRLLPVLRRAIAPGGALLLGRDDPPPRPEHGFARAPGRRRYVPVPEEDRAARPATDGSPPVVEAVPEQRAPDDAALRLIAAALEVGPVAVLIAQSPGGELRVANRHARELLGLRAEDVGRPLAVLAAERSLEALVDGLAAALDGAEEVRVPHLRLPDARGRMRDLELTAVPVRRADGPAAATVILRDVGEQLRREARLREADRDLEALFEELAATMGALDAATRQLERAEAGRRRGQSPSPSPSPEPGSGGPAS